MGLDTIKIMFTLKTQPTYAFQKGLQTKSDKKNSPVISLSKNTNKTHKLKM